MVRNVRPKMRLYDYAITLNRSKNRMKRRDDARDYNNRISRKSHERRDLNRNCLNMVQKGVTTRYNLNAHCGTSKG